MPVTVSAAVDNRHLKSSQGSFSVLSFIAALPKSLLLLYHQWSHPSGPEKQTQGVCSGNPIQGKEVGKTQPVTRVAMMTVLAEGPCNVPVRQLWTSVLWLSDPTRAYISYSTKGSWCSVTYGEDIQNHNVLNPLSQMPGAHFPHK